MKRQSPAPIMVIYANADIPDERGNVCLTPFADTETKLDISGWAMRVKAHIEHYAPAIESDRSYILAHGHDFVINLAERTVSLYDEELLLSQKQFDILCYLASHPGQVLSKSQIFNYLWEEQANETDNCVTLQISKLRKKLGDTPNAQEYIQTVRGVGYKFAK